MSGYDDIDLEVERVLEDLRTQQHRLEETQAELRATTVVGSAERGLVTVVVDGGGCITTVTIDPDAVRAFDADQLGRVVLAAIHDGMGQLVDLTKEKFAPFVGDAATLDNAFTYWNPEIAQDPGLRR